MATNSHIGILEPNGKISAIYCHNDGYPEGVGATLMKHYNSEEKARELINLGSISALRERIAPDKDEAHSFDQPIEDVTIAYVRDRGEAWEDNKPRIYASKSDYIERGFGYLYLYDTQTQQWTLHR